MTDVQLVVLVGCAAMLGFALGLLNGARHLMLAWRRGFQAGKLHERAFPASTEESQAESLLRSVGLTLERFE